MGAAGKYFVTPHACAAFQRRVADLDYEHALGAILRAMASPVAYRMFRDDDGRLLLELAVDGTCYSFVARVRPSDDSGRLPVVVTILSPTRGEDGGRRRSPRWKSPGWTAL